MAEKKFSTVTVTEYKGQARAYVTIDNVQVGYVAGGSQTFDIVGKNQIKVSSYANDTSIIVTGDILFE